MFTIISRFNENLAWLNGYNFNGIIINKGNNILERIRGFKILMRPNFGANQYDICNYIYNNYDNLPNTMMFIQGYPFDHCSKLHFDLKTNLSIQCFLEDSAKLSNKNTAWRLSEEIDCGFSEKNTSWYIDEINYNQIIKNNIKTTNIISFDEFANLIFDNYQSLSWLRFSPGSQYIITKSQCTRYSRNFWKILMNFIPQNIGINGGVEAHLIERSLGLIFYGIFNERDFYNEKMLTPKNIVINRKISMLRYKIENKIFKRMLK